MSKEIDMGSMLARPTIIGEHNPRDKESGEKWPHHLLSPAAKLKCETSKLKKVT